MTHAVYTHSLLLVFVIQSFCYGTLGTRCMCDHRWTIFKFAGDFDARKVSAGYIRLRVFRLSLKFILKLSTVGVNRRINRKCVFGIININKIITTKRWILSVASLKHLKGTSSRLGGVCLHLFLPNFFIN